MERMKFNKLEILVQELIDDVLGEYSKEAYEERLRNLEEFIDREIEGARGEGKKAPPSYTADEIKEVTSNPDDFVVKATNTADKANETDPHDSLRTGTLPVVEEIEKLDRRLYSDYDNGVGVHYIYPDNEELMGKLNEVITAVNKLTNKK